MLFCFTLYNSSVNEDIEKTKLRVMMIYSKHNGRDLSLLYILITIIISLLVDFMLSITSCRDRFVHKVQRKSSCIIMRFSSKIG